MKLKADYATLKVTEGWDKLREAIDLQGDVVPVVIIGHIGVCAALTTAPAISSWSTCPACWWCPEALARLHTVGSLSAPTIVVVPSTVTPHGLEWKTQKWCA
jgi:hypothetical protein